jgi:putative addiction module killer protein
MADEEIIIMVLIDSRLIAPFFEWLESIKDVTHQASISRNVQKLARCLGDRKNVGEGVWELRIDVGPGYRVYYANIGKEYVLLLGGGDKSSQTKDITSAKQLLESFEKLGRPEAAILLLDARNQDEEASKD